LSLETRETTSVGIPGGGGALPRKRRFGAETLFRGTTTAAGTVVLVIIVAIAVFLIAKAVPAIRADGSNFLTEKNWFTGDTPPKFGVAAIAVGTVQTAVIALLMAVPVSMGIALFLSHYAPKALANVLGFMIDLLAAVPSVVFGLWGRDSFAGPVRDLSGWLHHYFGWIPIFGSDGPYGQSLMLGGLVLAIMVLPIVTSLSREVFRQTPAVNEEAAFLCG